MGEVEITDYPLERPDQKLQIDVIELGSVQERNQLSEYIFVYVHNSLFKFGRIDTNSNRLTQFSTYNNLNFKIFKELFWFV